MTLSDPLDSQLCRTAFETKIAESWRALKEGALRCAEGFGWMNLPDSDAHLLAETARFFAPYDYIILLGIGGSALGTQMLVEVLAETSCFTAEEKKRPLLLVADNADAETGEAIWQRVVPERTALLVVSKSGRTLETMCNFLFFREKLLSAVGEQGEKQMFAVTDASQGFLRRYVKEKGTASAEFPRDTGGRYSVLSPCSLVAAAALGVDIRSLLRGARTMKESLLCAPSVSNLASQLTEAVLRAWESGKNVTVFMTYGDRLESVGEWFAQLWGESLGKQGTGLTPQCACGSVDQHSQLQLYAEGPNDKFFIFLSSRPGQRGVLSVPREALFDEARCLEGMSMESVLDCERRGVIASLKRRRRSVCSLELERTDAFCLGGLIFLLEAVTALTGLSRGVDPFDQPGVEEGKNYALALCGSAEYSKYLKDVTDAEGAEPSSIFEV
ncbi:MAG: glucose-6-phosphate isomerase [Pyramidobacter sp.]|nr:glucose-6-phosphate isomerase [Pyramidobacter sp.]